MRNTRILKVAAALLPTVLLCAALDASAETARAIPSKAPSKVASKVKTTKASQPVEASQWLQSQGSLSVQKIIENISPANPQDNKDPRRVTRAGAVIAARSLEKPDYYFHWVRDAGIVMDGVASEYNLTKDPEIKKTLRRKLSEYLDYSSYIQQVPAPTGLGEPKFHVNGDAYTDPWGRPQNDGPALRAISLLRWAQILIQDGEIDFVRQNLYASRLPAVSVLKRDLEFVSHRWQEKSFDIWEEVRGDHFYTMMVQRKALIEGSLLAEALGDHAAAHWYKQQSQAIEAELAKFWDDSKGHFIATRNRVEGLDYKHTLLDTAVILGLLHGSRNDGFLPFSDSRVLMTLEKLTKAFYDVYKVNKNPGSPGVAIGRYPEDRYGGDNFEGGNPWPMTTLAVAEAYYRAAAENISAGKPDVAAKMIAHADTFVDRVRYHANADGSLSEQIDRNTGYMTSVPDLTWNYAAILATLTERNRAISTTPARKK